MEDEFGETWVTYGVIMRLPFKEIKHIQQILKDRGMHVYDRISIGRLIIKEEIPPSGSNEGGDVEK